MRLWKLNFKKEVAGASSNPKDAFAWISDVEVTSDWTKLADSGRYPSLDAKISAGLSKVIHGELARIVTLREEEASMKGEMLMGRQLAWMIFDHFKISEQEGPILEYKDLFALEFKTNLKGFLNEWDSVILGMKTVPAVDILESLFRAELEKDTSIKDLMHSYEQDFHQNGKPRSYGSLQSICKIEINRRQLKTNQDNYRGAGGDGRNAYAAQGECHQFS